MGHYFSLWPLVKISWFNQTELHWIILLLYIFYANSTMLQSVLTLENVRVSLERDKELLQNSSQPSWITSIPFQPWRILKWRAYSFRLLFPHSYGHFLGCEKWKCTNGPFSEYFDCQLLCWRQNFLHVLSFSQLEPKILFFHLDRLTNSSLLMKNTPRTNISFQLWRYGHLMLVTILLNCL